MMSFCECLAILFDRGNDRWHRMAFPLAMMRLFSYGDRVPSPAMMSFCECLAFPSIVALRVLVPLSHSPMSRVRARVGLSSARSRGGYSNEFPVSSFLMKVFRSSFEFWA